MSEAPRIRVSVVYAEPGRPFAVELELPRGATVAAAIAGSGIRRALPHAEVREDRLGIFARKVSPDTVLRDGDRVEVYRPLQVDPGEARRRRCGKVDRTPGP